ERVQGGIVLVAAEQEDALPLRRERPQRAAFAPDAPTRLIQGDHCGAGDQVAQEVELPVPVLRQLAQQGVGLGLGQRQPTEERQDRAGLVQRDADDVHQEGQHHQDLDAVLAAGRDAGDARLGGAGAGEQAVTDQYRSAIDQAPDGTFTDQVAVAVADTFRIEVLQALRLREFQLGWATTRRSLAPPSALAALGFRVQAVGGGRGLRGRGGLAACLGLILGQPLREALDGGFEPLDGLLLLVNDLQQLLDRQPTLENLGSQLAYVHAVGLVKLWQHRQEDVARMDVYPALAGAGGSAPGVDRQREGDAMRKRMLGAAILLGLVWAGGRLQGQRYLSGIIWPEPPVVTPGEGNGPPSDAVVLFDGKNFDAWDGARGWKVDPDGGFTVKGFLQTKQ